jgi:hypothetical protein
MKVFVAGTLSPGPAAIGKMNSHFRASSLPVSFVMHAVTAPESHAAAACSIRSALVPDCEIAKNSWSPKRNRFR